MQETTKNNAPDAAHATRFGADVGVGLVRLLAALLILFASPLWIGNAGLLRAEQLWGLPSAQHDQREINSPASTPGDDPPENRIHSLPAGPVFGYIEESIPEKYKKRYSKWKKEFLATEAGRYQWETYAHHPTLILTITVSREKTTGASASKFNWDESGNLIGATITLGSNIDDGYPGPVFYPVLNSLKRVDGRKAPAGSILAAAKIAHEFEHINQASAGGLAYRATNEMIKTYNKLFVENGHNTRDPKLLELAVKMGGTPVEICEDREHGAEIRAMCYLFERLTDDELRRVLLANIKETINFFAVSFKQRYAEFIQAQGLSVKRLALATKAER